MKLIKNLWEFRDFKYLAVALCIIWVFTTLTKQVHAAPEQFEDNYYDFVQLDNISWFTAKTEAETSLYNGCSGHLATINSEEENDFLYSLISGTFTGFIGAWLGGKAPEGWLVGPDTGYGFSYVNWGGGEPNNAGYAYMNIGTFDNGVNSGEWADDSGVQGYPSSSDPVIGYFVEYENPAQVPLPSTILFFGTGIVGLIGARIRGAKN